MNHTQLQEILLHKTPSEGLRRREGELFVLIPALRRCKGFDQNNPWHIYDVYDHILKVVDGVPPEPAVRLAALFHDVGKPAVYHADEAGVGHFFGHWEQSVEIFEGYAGEQCLPTALTETVSRLIFYHDFNFGRCTDAELAALLPKFTAAEWQQLYAIKRADLLAQSPAYHGLLEEYRQQEQRILDRKRLRPARPEDAGAILQLYRGVIGSPHCVWSEQYPSRLEIDRDIAAGGLYLYCDGEVLLGALSVVADCELSHCPDWRAPGNACELARVAIARQYHGQGLAARMVAAAEPIMRQMGFDTVHLAVGIPHLPARTTYEKLGYTAVGKTFIFGADYILMEKML